MKFAAKLGYNIKVLRGYNFSRTKDVFKSYVDKINKIKSNPKNNTQKAIAKSLLNNLLGRFSINLEKSVTEVMSIKEFDTRSTFNRIVSDVKISEDKILVTYLPKLDENLIKHNDLDITKPLTKYKDHEIQFLDAFSIVISAAVIAYGRIYMNKLKLDLLNKGGNLHYSDTDSIVTDIKLPVDMVDKNQIGKLKLEHQIYKSIFIRAKVYCFVKNLFDFITKAKGIIAKSLSWTDYFSLLNNINVDTTIKKNK